MHSTEATPPAIGLDDFKLMRVIGRGSYAKVFVVELKKTKRVYAMKVIKKELVNDDEVSFFHNFFKIFLLSYLKLRFKNF